MDDNAILTYVQQLEDPNTNHTDAAALAATLVNIDVNNLADAIVNQPSLYAYFGALWEAQRSREALAKHAYENAKADTYKELLQHGKSATAAKELINSEDAVKEAYVSYQQQAHITGLFRSVVSAFEQRKDMLVQISARQRVELSSY